MEPDKPEKLVIGREELFTPSVEAALSRQMSFGMDRGSGLVPQKPKGLLHKSWFMLMLAGGLGAFLAWAALEPFFEDFETVTGRLEEIEEGPGGPLVAELTVGGTRVLLLESTWIASARDEKKRLAVSDLVQDSVVEARGEGAREEGGHAFLVATEVLLRPDDKEPPPPVDLGAQEVRHMIVGLACFPAIACMVGLFIGATDGILSRAYWRAFTSGAVSLATGLALGAVCCLLATVAYGLAQGLVQKIDADSAAPGFSRGAFLVQVMGRGVAWAFAGIAMGLGQGIALRSRKLLLNGLVGGLVGGLLGGLLFDPIDRLLQPGGGPPDGAEVSRMIGFVVIGLSTGLMIGIVELLAREAWVRMLTGPITGKEFILYRNPTTIGSSPKSEIYLFKDPDVEVVHALVHQAGEGYEIEDRGTPAGTWINGRRVRRQRLSEEDQIRIGNTVMGFHMKEG